MKTIGVIGAGQMGTGIAHVFALAGYEVRLNDQSEEAIERSIAKTEANLDRQLAKDTITEDDKRGALERIHKTRSLNDFADVDVVIEAATENEAVKCAIFEEVIKHIRKDTILTTNTSSLSITRLAAVTDRPEHFMGFHFMNPVPVMELVELIRGIATANETFEIVQNIVKDLGKTATISEDYPAFIVNRILIPMINEAAYCLHEGVGTLESIDISMKLGANHPMGPLELADFIGLDTCLSIMNVLYDGLGDSKYRPCPLLVKYVEAGWIGRKVKRGFYDYRHGGDPFPSR